MYSLDSIRLASGMFRKIGIIGLFALLIFLAAAGAIYLKGRADSRRTRAEIEKRVAALRAAGQPVTAQDMARLYPDPPPEKDAARLLAPAMHALSIPDPIDDFPILGKAPLPLRGEKFSAEMETNIQALLEDNQKALSAVPWDSITNAWIGSGFTNGFTNLTNFRLTPVHQLAQLLCLGAINDAQFGRGKNAGQRLGRSLDLIRIMRSDVFIHHLCLRAYEREICFTLERVVNHMALSQEQLSSLQDALADDRPKSFSEAFVNLRWENIVLMEMMRTASPSAFASITSGPSDSDRVIEIKRTIAGLSLWLSGRTYSESDLLEILDVRAEQVAALKMPPKPRFTELLRIQSAIRKWSQYDTVARNYGNSSLNFPRLAQNEMEVLAKLRTAQTAMAVVRWRQAHDQNLPQSLSDLMPDFLAAIPTDPFDDQPVRYRKLARGYVVYSIGPDFTDDGGKEKPEEPKDSEHYDITFIVER